MIYESTTIKTKAITMEDGSCMATRTRTAVKVDGLRVYVSRSKRTAAEVSELDAFDAHDDFSSYHCEHQKQEAYK